jgi:DNA-binding phage protein
MGSAQPFAEPPHCADTVFRPRGTNRRRKRVYQENAEGAVGRDRIGSEADEGDDIMSEKNQHWGSTLDDFLREEGIYEAAKTEAVTRVISWQLAEEMRKRGMTKTQMAEQMHTSRAQVDRILKAKGNVTIETLQRAAALVGRELRLELV